MFDGTTMAEIKKYTFSPEYISKFQRSEPVEIQLLKGMDKGVVISYSQDKIGLFKFDLVDVNLPNVQFNFIENHYGEINIGFTDSYPIIRYNLYYCFNLILF